MNLTFDVQALTLGLSLLGLICINILLGSITAILQKQFDKTKLLQGIIKGIIVCVSFIGCYFIGVLNPDVIVINANGQDVNLLTAVNIIVLSGYVWYGKEVLTKLASFVNGSFIKE